MKKILIIPIVLLFLALPLFASPYFDFAFMLGQSNFTWPLDGIGISYGFSMGITDNLELDVWGSSKLIPEPFDTNILCAEISATLLGQRNTGSKVSGVNVNTLLSLGGFWKSDDNGLGIMLGLTPIALGSPSNVRRERCLRTNIGWDFRNEKLIVLFSPMDVEIYIKGTYRDWM